MPKRRTNGQGCLFKRTDGGPWLAAWYDYAGRRHQRSTRTTDRSGAERILNKLVDREALKREGCIDPRQDSYSTANRLPLADHVAEYLRHCERTGQAVAHIAEKKRHLENTLTATGASRLSELTGDALEKHCWAMKQAGLSARTANFARQAAVAFMGWAVKTNRIEGNPLAHVAKLDERNDRRRVRRALSDDELSRLLDVAEPRGRKTWYMAAALAGLRLGDLRKLTWGNVDLTAGTITVTNGKAKRTDVIPLHPQLADELRRRRESVLALPGAKVFPTTVTNITVQKDLLRAGIARREVVTDAEGKPIMTGKGKRQRPRTRITTEDAEGRCVDLHALRTTLGTSLARAGVAPQLAQRIMRHGDYRTTLKHYTVLGLVDTAKAISAVPAIQDRQTVAQAETGTDGPSGACQAGQDARQLQRQQLRRETALNGAKQRGAPSGKSDNGDFRKPRESAALRGTGSARAPRRSTAGDGSRTHNSQLGRLAL